MVSWILSLPLWQIIRSLGVVSYVLLAAGICLGILYSFPFRSPKDKARIYKLHSFFTGSGTVMGMLHGVITVIDTYTTYSWSEVLIPFTAKHHPILSGFGTLTVYGLLLVILTTDLRGLIKAKLWRWFHLLSYPIFIMAFVHGYFLGSDTKHFFIWLIYIISMAAVLALTAARFLFRKSTPAIPVSKSNKQPVP